MSRLPLLLLLLPAIGCSDEPAAPVISNPLTPQFTSAFNVTRHLLAQARLDDIVKVERKTGDWKFELKAEAGWEIAIRKHDYAPGSYTGWHSHPGPVLIQVTQGTVTFYENDGNCTATVVHQGESYVDLGEHPHIGRNEDPTQAAEDYTVLFGPPGTTIAGFRNDEPAPPAGQCPFEN